MFESFEISTVDNHGCASGASRAARRAHIEQAVAHVLNVDDRDLDRPTRGRARVAQARQVAMYVTHIACQMSFTDVGQLFGRDRTTVAHACAAVEDRRDDPNFDRAIGLLELVIPAILSPRRAVSSAI